MFGVRYVPPSLRVIARRIFEVYYCETGRSSCADTAKPMRRYGTTPVARRLRWSATEN